MDPERPFQALIGDYGFFRVIRRTIPVLIKQAKDDVPEFVD
jgi:hypothetical protein